MTAVTTLGAPSAPAGAGRPVAVDGAGPDRAQPGRAAPPAPGGLLRLATAGSVDDGKSTLVGRLLHDTRSVLADTLDAVHASSRARGRTEPDLSLLVDGLRAEREQGITIDVAHRYFATPRRAFVLADTPGHVQYTRNMVTGASTADLALVLVDARAGVVEQTRRHVAVAALLGVPHLTVAVNKMDLVGFDAGVFAAVRDAFAAVAAQLGAPAVVAVPVSALAGDNVVERSARTPWYDGPTLLEHLEAVEVGETGQGPFRMPVQVVVRPGDGPHRDYRGYAGRITSGVLAVGDPVAVQPSGATTTVAGLELLGRPVAAAGAGASVTVLLADDVDAARGDLLADPSAPPRVARDLSGAVAVLDDRPLLAGQRVLVRVGTRTVRGVVAAVTDRLDLATLAPAEATDALRLNDIGHVQVRLAEPVAHDDYAAARHTGAFLLLDEHDGTTRAAGMARAARAGADAGDGCPQG